MQFGNVNVTIVVSVIGDGIVNPIPCPLDAFEIAHLFQVALESNLYFEQVVSSRSSQVERMLFFRFLLQK